MLQTRLDDSTREKTVSESTAAVPSKESRRTVGAISPALVVPWAVLIALTVWGAGYYFAPLGERMRSDLHDLLRPSGTVGQSAGILTFAGFLFLWLYPMRKKLGAAGRWMGAIARWLDVHIVVGLTVPLLGAVHAAWRFEGVIGLGYWAMAVVALSGIVGRYVYVRIPRDRAGLELGAEDLAQRRRGLLLELTQVTGLQEDVIRSTLAANPEPVRGVIPSLVRMVRDDFARRRAVADLRRRWVEVSGDEVDEEKLREVARLARRQMQLTQQAKLLGQTHRIFGHWHTLHRPVAITALLAVTIHVAVVIWSGTTWFY